MKKEKKRSILCALLIAALLSGLCMTPAHAAGGDWRTAYQQVLRNLDEDYELNLLLADLDLDGSPELFIRPRFWGTEYQYPDLLYVYTMENGTIKSIDINGDYVEELSMQFKVPFSYNDLFLYRNDRSGAYRIEGFYTVKEMGYYINDTSVYTYALRNGKLISEFSGFSRGSNMGAEIYYANGARVSAAAYERLFNAWHAGWTQLELKQTRHDTEGRISDREIREFLNSYEATALLAKPGTHKLRLNGKPVTAGAYNIHGNNYFKLRDVAMLLRETGNRFQVRYDQKRNRIELISGEAYSPVGGELAAGSGVNQIGTETTSDLVINGWITELTSYNINGYNYFKLRDLGEELGFAVDWDSATSTVKITTEEPAAVLPDGEHMLSLRGTDIYVENGVTYLRGGVLSYVDLPDAVVSRLKVGDTVELPGRYAFTIRSMDRYDDEIYFNDGIERCFFSEDTNSWRFTAPSDMPYTYEIDQYELPLAVNADIRDHNTFLTGKNIYGVRAYEGMSMSALVESDFTRLNRIQDYFLYPTNSAELHVQVKNAKIVSVIIPYQI